MGEKVIKDAQSRKGKREKEWHVKSHREGQRSFQLLSVYLSVNLSDDYKIC